MPIRNSLTPAGENALGAAFGYYPQIQRQGAIARQLAQARDVNTMPDPRTYAAVSGFLGTAPDEMGFSAMHPDIEGIKATADPAYALGTAAAMAPIIQALAQARMVRQALMAGGRYADRVVPQIMERGGLPAEILQGMAQGTTSQAIGRPTVMRPQRVGYPGIYGNPKELVAEAASRVAPENPLLEQLFGVNRQDLWDISQQGTRQGNITERPFKAAAKGKGAAHASEVMNPRNENRLLSILEEAKKQPDLYQGMASWYTMDPLFQQFQKIYGVDKAVEEYNKFNTLTGMASPGSEVLTEFNRGTGANWLAKQNRFADFQKYGGQAEFRRGADFPEDMRGIIGHPYHSTAHSNPMSKYVESGVLDMGSAKVPSYIAASGVPETGFQTQWPVGDAHWSRLVGLPDVRGASTKKGIETVPNASASVQEMTSLGPWWRDRIAAQAGLEAVPAQAVVWGAGSGATGVTSPIGAGKLELLAQQIGKAAQRMGVSPETARDLIISGKAHAGFVTPEMAAAIAGATSAGLLGNEYLRGGK